MRTSRSRAGGRGCVRVRPGTWGFGAGPRRGVFRAVGSRPVSIGSRRDGAFARGSNRGSGCRAVRSEARSAVGSVARLAVGRVMRSGARPAVRSETRSAARLAVRSAARVGSASGGAIRGAIGRAIGGSIGRPGSRRGRGPLRPDAVHAAHAPCGSSGAAAAAGAAGTDASRSVRSACASFSVGRARFACPRTGARFGDGRRAGGGGRLAKLQRRHRRSVDRRDAARAGCRARTARAARAGTAPRRPRWCCGASRLRPARSCFGPRRALVERAPERGRDQRVAQAVHHQHRRLHACSILRAESKRCVISGPSGSQPHACCRRRRGCEVKVPSTIRPFARSPRWPGGSRSRRRASGRRRSDRGRRRVRASQPQAARASS